ncbi:MAG: hypothetical protein PVI57_14965 [Gemmatimonadota bacterium]
MSLLKLLGGMALLVVVGAPMVWYLWEVLTQLLAGTLDARSLLIAVPVLVVFLAFLWFVSRTVQNWDRRWSA